MSLVMQLGAGSLAMQRYSIKPRDQIFADGYEFLSFLRNRQNYK